MMGMLRFLRQLPWLLLSPFLLAMEVATLVALDLAWALFGSKQLAPDTQPRTAAASVVIPNWNGKDLLAKYLPSVVEAMAGRPGNETIVVDNGSSDGSVDFIRQNFPAVKVIALPENLGFGGGSNRGFAAAKNDIVVLLNSDMRVAPDFLAPLLEGFQGADVFAVSCQIYFSDAAKVREETGLTQASWRRGMLRLGHRIDERITGLYPCFYGGGGSCAFDRKKFLELGGFDELLRPFYLEDTDLGMMAWKRGWQVLFQPRSAVWHEHRGTIGNAFSKAYINAIVEKNFILFIWKNIHSWPMLLEHFAATNASALVAALFGYAPGRSTFRGLARAAGQLPEVLGARWRAKRLAAIGDREALRRPLGGYYRDRFVARGAVPERPKVLMVSPYGLAPASHGGAVFMQHAVREMHKRTDVHLIALLDEEWERAAHEELRSVTGSMQFIVRMTGQPGTPFSLLPSAVTEFASEELEWTIHRTMLLERIDVLQIEYSNLGQYACQFERLVAAIFEHDIYFQSISRQLRTNESLLWRIPASIEYLKSMHWELRMLRHFDLVQVCTEVGRAYLLSLQPKLAATVKAGMRASIEVDRFTAALGPRAGNTIVFVGGFRHLPNLEALQWFFSDVVPELKKLTADFRVVAVGVEPPPAYTFAHSDNVLELPGYVEDIRPLMTEAAVFICPIRSGSGVRVKLLEAFAYGIPVVSTRIGAEGLASEDGLYCRLAEDGGNFAAAIADLFRDREKAEAMARRARQYVEREWDSAAATDRLVDEYLRLLRAKAISSGR